jgi:acetyl esterase/lipase
MKTNLVTLLGVLVLLAGCEQSPPLTQACPGPQLVARAQPIEEPCTEQDDPRIQQIGNDRIQLTSPLGLPSGRYVLPSNTRPTQLVIMFHGHGNNSCSWRNHLRAAADHGAIAVAMDYTGTVSKDTADFGLVEIFGWFARAGAADSIAAARYFMDKYPSIKEVFNFAVSMGGNMGGVAIYSPAGVRADCSPLWDWWVAAEGVHNLTEEYTGARSVGQQSADPDLKRAGALAAREIEEENGGTVEAVPDAYAEITNSAHADGMLGLKGAVFVHGSNDTTVPNDQSRQMAHALNGLGVASHVFIITGQDHNWEGSNDPVMAKSLEELWGLMGGGSVTPGETVVP